MTKGKMLYNAKDWGMRKAEKISYNAQILKNDFGSIKDGVGVGFYKGLEAVTQGNFGIDKRVYLQQRVEEREERSIENALAASLANFKDFTGNQHILSNELLDIYAGEVKRNNQTGRKVLNFGQRLVPFVGSYAAKGRESRQQIYNVMSQVQSLSLEKATLGEYEKLNTTTSRLSTDAKRTLIALGYNEFVQNTAPVELFGFGGGSNETYSLAELAVTYKDRVKDTLGKSSPLLIDAALLGAGGGVFTNLAYKGLERIGWQVAPAVANLGAKVGEATFNGLGNLTSNLIGYEVKNLVELIPSGASYGIEQGKSSLLKNDSFKDTNGNLNTKGKILAGTLEFLSNSLSTVGRVGGQGALGGADAVANALISTGLVVGSSLLKTGEKYTSGKLSDALGWLGLVPETALVGSIALQDLGYLFPIEKAQAASLKDDELQITHEKDVDSKLNQ